MSPEELRTSLIQLYNLTAPNPYLAPESELESLRHVVSTVHQRVTRLLLEPPQ